MSAVVVEPSDTPWRIVRLSGCPLKQINSTAIHEFKDSGMSDSRMSDSRMSDSRMSDSGMSDSGMSDSGSVISD